MRKKCGMHRKKMTNEVLPPNFFSGNEIMEYINFLPI